MSAPARAATPALRTTTGRAVALGAEVARGGEAVVHAVAGQPHVLAKVYLAPRAGAGDKLGWMRGHPPRERSGVAGHCTIAWPTELLIDGRGACVGYLMPRIDDAVPLLDVLNPRRRAAVLPAFDHAYVLRTARNLAAAIAALHDCGTVVGDLHERNVLVTRRALVTVIDADSFQVQRLADDAIVIHPCPVGRAEYTPPELQGQAFRNIVRQPAHDAFGLAVLVFQLLHGGSHPFRGRWLGPGEAPPTDEKIRRGWFPWQPPAGAPVAPPPGVPPLAQLDPGVQRALLACFVAGHDDPSARPSAADWERILGQAEADLATCPAGHVHAGHLVRCPRCGARSGRGGWPGLRRRLADLAPAPRPTTARVPPPRPSPTGPRRAPATGAHSLATSGRPASPATPSASPAVSASARQGGRSLAWAPAAWLAGAWTRLWAAVDGALRIAVALGLAAAAGATLALLARQPASPGAQALAAALVGHVAGALAVAIAPRALRRRDGARLAEPLPATVATTAALAAGWLAAAALPGLAARLMGATDALSATGLALGGPDAAPASVAWVVGFALYGSLLGHRGTRWDGRRILALAPQALAGAFGWLAAWLAG